jgi:hypothetical protein
VRDDRARCDSSTAFGEPRTRAAHRGLARRGARSVSRSNTPAAETRSRVPWRGRGAIVAPVTLPREHGVLQRGVHRRASRLHHPFLLIARLDPNPGAERMRQSQLRVRPRVRRVLQLLRERDLGAIRQAGHEGLDILTLKSVRPAPRDCQASEAIRACRADSEIERRESHDAVAGLHTERTLEPVVTRLRHRDQRAWPGPSGAPA